MFTMRPNLQIESDPFLKIRVFLLTWQNQGRERYQNREEPPTPSALVVVGDETHHLSTIHHKILSFDDDAKHATDYDK